MQQFALSAAALIAMAEPEVYLLGDFSVPCILKCDAD